MREHIKPDDIVLFTDAYDVIYGGKLREVMLRYEAMRKPIIFGCETECNPDPTLKSLYKNTGEEFSFLNSGMFIGKVYALRKLMEKYEYDDKHDDQLYWTRHFLNNPDLIGLDYRNELFLNTYKVDMEDIRLDRTHFGYKGRDPQFVHVNGPDKNDLMHFLYKYYLNKNYARICGRICKWHCTNNSRVSVRYDEDVEPKYNQ